jgi:enoyl-[acyl-carrier-protein] reductase (NADH)
VLWLQTTGIPEAYHDTDGPAPAYGTGQPMSGEELVGWLKSKTMLDRLTALADVGHTAAFLASDRVGGMTAAGVNLSCGSVPTR